MKPRIGRPRLPYSEVRQNAVYLWMQPDEKVRVREEAKRNARSMSEQCLIWVRAALSNPALFNDLDQLRQKQAVTARRVLLDSGWKVQAKDPNYTEGEHLLAPEVAYSPTKGFISDEELERPMANGVNVHDVEPIVRGILEACRIPGVDRPLWHRTIIKSMLALAPQLPQEAEQETSPASPDKKEGEAA
jgi:hypothetical protein